MSSVPAVLAALVSLGIAWLPSNVQTVNGGITSETITKERYFLVGDEEIVVDWQFDSMGTTLSEQYVVPLTAGADLQTTDQTVADQAADDIRQAMLTAILGHPQGPTLGLGDGVSVLPVGEHRFLRAASQNGKHAAWRWGVRVYAQTT